MLLNFISQTKPLNSFYYPALVFFLNRSLTEGKKGQDRARFTSKWG